MGFHFFFFFFFFFLFRATCVAYEIPRLGVKSELQLPAYTIATVKQDPSHVWDYITTAHDNARSLTH